MQLVVATYYVWPQSYGYQQRYVYSYYPEQLHAHMQIVYVRTCVRIYTYIYVYIYIYIYVRINTYVRTYVYIYIYTYVRTRLKCYMLNVCLLHSPISSKSHCAVAYAVASQLGYRAKGQAVETYSL